MKTKNEIIAGKDYKQQVLCVNCWDGAHYFKWVTSYDIGDGKPHKEVVASGAGAFSNCLEGDCECHCRELVKNRRQITAKTRERVKAEKAAQMSIPGTV